MFASIGGFLSKMSGTASAFPFDVKDEIAQKNNHTGWKMYKGNRAGTGEDVSIFCFDKKTAKPEAVAAAKNHAKRMKTLRYPQVLKYLEEQETEDMLRLVTEAVQPLEMFSLDLSDPLVTAQISLGLHQVISSIAWLNNDCKMVHGALCPASIFVTPAGDWRLAGFDISYGGPGVGSAIPQAFKDSVRTLLPVAYQCPEVVQGQWSALEAADCWSIDSWALGCLMFEIHNGSLTSGSQLTSPGNIPASLLPLYKKCLSTSVSKRLNPRAMLASDATTYFQNELVRTVSFLDELALKTPGEKDAFFARFTKSLLKKNVFPLACCRFKMLPLLVGMLEYGSVSGGSQQVGGSAAAALSSFGTVLSCVMQIGADLNEKDFAVLVTPSVVKLFANTERGVRICLLKTMPEYHMHLTADLVEQQVFPQLIGGFSDGSALLRELSVKSLALLVPKLTQATVSSKVVPLLAKLQTDPEPAIRTNTTLCLGKIATSIDVGSQQRVLIPGFLRALKDPFAPARTAGLMGLNATRELYTPVDIATKILPNIVASCVDSEKSVRDACLAATQGFVAILLTNSDVMTRSAAAQQQNQPAGGAASNTNSNNSTTSGVGGGGGGGLMSMVGSMAVSAVKSKVFGTVEAMAGMEAGGGSSNGGKSSSMQNHPNPNSQQGRGNTGNQNSPASSKPAAAPAKPEHDDFFDDFNDEGNGSDDGFEQATVVAALSSKKKPDTAVKKPLPARKTTTTSSSASSAIPKKVVASTKPVVKKISVTSLDASAGDWDFDIGDNSKSNGSQTAAGGDGGAWGDWDVGVSTTSGDGDGLGDVGGEDADLGNILDDDFSSMLSTSSPSSASSALSTSKKPVHAAPAVKKAVVKATPIAKSTGGEDWGDFDNF